MNKKQKVIILGLALLLIVALALILFFNFSDREDQKLAPQAEETIFVPEFMSVEEKQSRGFDVESQIQVLKKDEAGQTEIYRIIRPGRDIVNPAEIEAIN